jgi:ubiquinone/menaquinone biosynthesis C-methylase UbiE
MDATKFYPNRHLNDSSYSGGEYDVDALFSIRAVKQWLSEHCQSPLRVVDVGCGKGWFLREFLTRAKSGWNIQKVEANGVDLVCSPGNFHKEISPDFKFFPMNLDGAKLPFEDASMDFMCCNHVIEHLFETEKLVREFRRVLKPNGLAVISVPNTACWLNRALFIFGGQPLGSELGTETISYGFWPRFMQKRMENWTPSGHIRDFTPRGLEDMTNRCGFKTAGWWAQSPGLVAKLGKWAGRNVGIVLKTA